MSHYDGNVYTFPLHQSTNNANEAHSSRRAKEDSDPRRQLPRFGGLSHFGGAFGFHSEPQIPQGFAAKQPLAKT
jgi:hypothetical protein